MKQFLVILFLFILSCSTTKSYPPERSGDSGLMVDGTMTDNMVLAADKIVQDRKVIYDVHYSLESEQPDSIIERIKKLTGVYKGYMVNIAKNNIRIRIPASESESMVSEIEQLAVVVDKNLSGRDITEQYSDLEIRLDNIEKARQRYLQLLDKAENVTAALKVEKELERLQREYDILKGRQQRWAHLVEYITIDIYVAEGSQPGPLSYLFIGMYQAVKWLFVW